MKKTLKEELERIHTITYGKENLSEGFMDSILNKVGGSKIDDPKKTDLVSDDVSEFFKTLENSVNSGGLSQQKKNEMSYQKSVESMQIGLTLLGYQLPNYGVDGLFGPETSNAIMKFELDNKIQNNDKVSGDVKLASPEMLKKLIEMLKSKGVKSEDIKQKIDKSVSVAGLVDKNFYSKLLENLGAPVTDGNLEFLYAWKQAEGHGGKFNPFNTTLNLPGAQSINADGVKNYDSMEQGMEATVKTLRNQRYGCIVDGLKNNIGASNIAKCQSLKTWGTGDLVAKVVSGYDRGNTPKISGLA